MERQEVGWEGRSTPARAVCGGPEEGTCFPSIGHWGRVAFRQIAGLLGVRIRPRIAIIAVFSSRINLLLPLVDGAGVGVAGGGIVAWHEGLLMVRLFNAASGRMFRTARAGRHFGRNIRRSGRFRVRERREAPAFQPQAAGPEPLAVPGNRIIDMEIEMKEKSLESAFADTLKDIYYAERQILKALPKMIRAAQSKELKNGLTKHREETEGQVERLEQVFEIIGKRAQGKTCPAINGILEEGAEVMEEYGQTPAIDAVLAAAGQAVEHYEIARYGTLCAWAAQLSYDDAIPLLQQTLEQEKAADEALSEVADQVNQTAMAAA